jgi:hypothetical protein
MTFAGGGAALALGPVYQGSGVPLLGRPAVDDLPPAIVNLKSPGTLVIEVPRVDVSPGHGDHHGMLRLPVHRVDVPVSGALHRFRVAVVDSAGRAFPPDRIHHFILFDPDHRELFESIVMRVLAAGKETGDVSLPRLLFGMPLRAGQRLILSGMISNPGTRPMERVTLRLELDFVPAWRPWPVYAIYPWTIDVAWPLGGEGGSKAFDLPAGRFERSWEGSPAIPGKIVALGGHVHDYAERLELRDLTRGTVLWVGRPALDSAGRVTALSRGYFLRWYRLGIRILPSHRYRITVVYQNPTGRLLPDGGMGSISGVFVPDGPWPRVDPADSLYRRDLDSILRNMNGGMGHPAGRP